jgi:hypothetical protein
MAEEPNIQEAVFKYQLDHNAAYRPDVEVLYLSVGEKSVDPPDEFMLRFAEHVPPVRKVSSCVIEKNRVVDRQTGQRGLIFHVGRIKWTSDQKVEVEGGDYEHGLSSSGDSYTVVKKDGKWRVITSSIKWVS